MNTAEETNPEIERILLIICLKMNNIKIWKFYEETNSFSERLDVLKLIYFIQKIMNLHNCEKIILLFKDKNKSLPYD